MIAIAFIAGSVLGGLAVGMYYITVNRDLRRQIKALEHALWIERSENEYRIFEAITTALGYETDEQEQESMKDMLKRVNAVYIGTGGEPIKLVRENEQEHNHDTQ